MISSLILLCLKTRQWVISVDLAMGPGCRLLAQWQGTCCAHIFPGPCPQSPAWKEATQLTMFLKVCSIALHAACALHSLWACTSTEACTVYSAVSRWCFPWTCAMDWWGSWASSEVSSAIYCPPPNTCSAYVPLPTGHFLLFTANLCPVPSLWRHFYVRRTGFSVFHVFICVTYMMLICASLNKLTRKYLIRSIIAQNGPKWESQLTPLSIFHKINKL